ncbi:MAG: hypothetical protein LUQ11_10275 [Methylococcaceae bacterium]|nr:hypothetical protein [Methylococcaceae bacterium]
MGCHANKKTGEYPCHNGELKCKTPLGVETLVVSFANPARHRRFGNFLQLDYEGFTLWLDCGQTRGREIQIQRQ